MHAYRPDLPRRICEALMHDPLYDETAPWERWALCIIVAIAAIAVVAIGAYLYAAGTSPEKTPESPPAPAPATIPETVTEIPVGRLVCQRWERGGCQEWRIYREINY